MSETDFDTAGVAEYLHLPAEKVAKLTDRGKIPARRVAGEWRYSPAEINAWLEERIGVSDSDELERVEGALDRAGGFDEDVPETIAEILSVEAIDLALPARTRNAAIIAMSELLAGTGLMWDSVKMADAVRQREDMHPTALDNGVALLHPRRPMASILAEPVLALGRVDHGLPFSSSRGVLTDVLFLIGSTTDRGHLRVLARLSRLIAHPDFLPRLRAATIPGEALQVIVDCEVSLDGAES